MKRGITVYGFYLFKLLVIFLQVQLDKKLPLELYLFRTSLHILCYILHILGEIFDYRKIEGKSRREQKRAVVLILLWICTLNIT